MKTHSIVNYLFIFIFFFSTTMFFPHLGYASVPVSKGFTTFVVSAEQQIQADLVSKAWKDRNRILIFNETGFATVLLESSTAIDYLFWSLEVVNNQTYLTLTKSSGMQEQFRLVRTASALQWMDMQLDTIIPINALPLENAKQLEAIKSNLQGAWSCNIYPTVMVKNLEGVSEQPITNATFKFEFLSDGRFVKTVYLNQEYSKKVIGFWELSIDGKMLLVHVQQSKEQFQSFMLKIRHLALDELVLDNAIIGSKIENEICGEKSSFFFNKQ